MLSRWLRSEGLIPHTVGRNTFSSDAPLKKITELLDGCEGAVVIALERLFFREALINGAAQTN